jgi:thiamine-monophosphate kinase
MIQAMAAGGDDYELCFTAPPSRRARVESLSGDLGLPLTRIGRIVDGSSVRLEDGQGRPIDLQGQGFDHFR